MSDTALPGSPIVFMKLPGDDLLLAAAGKVALTHGQLEMTLRMTIKTLSRLSVREAMNATRGLKNWKLREETNKLFKHYTRDPVLRTRMNAILGNCKRLSEKRNQFIHQLWALDQDGSVVVKGSEDVWGPPPSVDDLTALAEEISTQAKGLNWERLNGFIGEVVKTAP